MFSKSNGNLFLTQVFIIITIGFNVALVSAMESGSSTNPYSFGGACGASQGSWTRLALEQTNKIRSITQNLKNDENCKNLGKALQAKIDSFNYHLKDIDTNMNQSESYRGAIELESSEKTIQALSTSMTDPLVPDSQKNGIGSLVMTQLQNNSIKRAKVNSGLENILVKNGISISSVSGNLKRGVEMGYDMFDGVLDSIPAVSECVADNNAYAQFAAATLQTAAAMFSSGTDPSRDPSGKRVGSILSKLANFARDYHFSKVLGLLNETEYVASISCLIEVATDNFCSTRDAQILLDEGLKSFSQSTNENQVNESDNDKQNVKPNLTPIDPLQGYYILTQHLPHVTDWLQKIQVGVAPKLPTDAVFKNSVIDDVMDFYKSVNTMIADFEKGKKTILDQKDIIAQRNTIIDLVISIANKMGLNSAGGFNPADMQKRNFFNYRVQPIYIPFVLIGKNINDIPKAVTSTEGQFRMAPEDYLRQEGSKMPEFENPNTLLDTLESNMNKIINETNLAVIEYHNTWLIVDPLSIYDQAITSMRYSVFDSLRIISLYLDNLYKRFSKIEDQYPEVQTSLISITDLKIRIENVLESFNTKLNSKDEAVQDLLKNSKEIVEYSSKILKDSLNNVDKTTQQQAYASFKEKADVWAKKFADSLYNNFSMLLARSGFLSNRLTTLVLQDYTLQTKYGSNSNGLSPYAKEIMVGLGRSAFDLLLQTAGDPATIQTDLSGALNIQKSNLEAIELLFKDKLIATIAKLNLFSKTGTKPSKKELLEDSLLRNYFDSKKPLESYELPTLITDQEYEKIVAKNKLCYVILDCNSPIISAIFFGNIYNLTKADIYYISHQERYFNPGLPILWRFGDESLSKDTEFGSIGRQRDLFCIQSLAFNDWKSFYPLCRNVVLKSPLDNLGGMNNKYLDVSYQHKLAENAKDNPGLNHSQRICAYRDYSRRNRIHWLSINQNKILNEIKQK